MALDGSSLVTTTGGSTSNSYVSLVEFAAYRDLNRITADSFDDATPDDKVRSLVMAFKRLNRELWIGSRVSDTQAGAWPRAGARKQDSGGGFDYLYGYASAYTAYSSEEIPQVVKDAQCELAFAYLDGFDDGEEDQIESFSADGVAVKFRQGRPQGGLPATVSQLLSGLLQGNRLVRS